MSASRYAPERRHLTPREYVYEIKGCENRSHDLHVSSVQIGEFLSMVSVHPLPVGHRQDYLRDRTD